MIGSIYSSSPSVQVSFSGGSNYVNNYSGAQGVGNMRYNTSNQSMEVFDGNGWIKLNEGSASVSLSQDVESLLDWARKKRNEEWELEALAKEHPTIKDLVDQINLKKEQIKMIQTLVKSPGNDAIKPSMIP